MTQPTFALATLADVNTNGLHAVAIGNKTREMTTEGALVASSAFAKLFTQSVPTMLAFEKAKHGNYRAATEIMALGATNADVKFLTPKEGKTWTKGSVLMLAEKTLEREAPGKGYTKKQLVARSLATAIIAEFTKPTAAHDLTIPA